ncbi:hypothetical protein D047_0516B, partial [Vibrio parahaemolyticus VPTS-2010_2]
FPRMLNRHKQGFVIKLGNCCRFLKVSVVQLHHFLLGFRIDNLRFTNNAANNRHK